MNITKISQNYYQTTATKLQQQPFFRNKQFEKVIVDVPKIKCACCGNKLLHGKIIENIWTKITKPLSSVMEKGAFDNWQAEFPKTYNNLQEMSHSFPETSLDSILEGNKDIYALFKTDLQDDLEKNYHFDNLENVQTLNRLNNIAFFYMLKTSRMNLKPAAIVMKKLAPLRDCLTGTPLNVYNEFRRLAKEYSYTPLSWIVTMKSVAEPHLLKNQNVVETNTKMINTLYSNIERFIEQAETDDEGYLKKIANDTKKLIYTIPDYDMRREKIKEMFSSAFKDSEIAERFQNKIFKQIDHLPRMKPNTDSFFASAYRQRFKDNNIVSSLLAPVTGMFAPVLDKYNIANDFDNQILLCSCCNRIRSGVPYAEYLKYKNDSPFYNTRAQLKLISKYIANKRNKVPEELKNYPEILATKLGIENSRIMDLHTYTQK